MVGGGGGPWENTSLCSVNKQWHSIVLVITEYLECIPISTYIGHASNCRVTPHITLGQQLNQNQGNQ